MLSDQNVGATKADRIREEIEKQCPLPRTSGVVIEVRGRAKGLTKVWLYATLKKTFPGKGSGILGPT